MSESVTGVKRSCSDAHRNARRIPTFSCSLVTSARSWSVSAAASSSDSSLIIAQASVLDLIALGPPALVKSRGWMSRWLGLFVNLSTSPGRAAKVSSSVVPKVATRVGQAVGVVFPRVEALPWSMGMTASAGRPMTLNGER